MAKFNVKDLIDKFTKDGEVDYAKINEELENQNRNIVVKETSKELDRIKEETLSNLIKELNIEGTSVDDVKLYIKQVSGSTDAAKEDVIKLTNEFNKLKKNYDAEVGKRTKLETDLTDKHQTELVRSLGITDEKQIEYFKWDFNKHVDETTTFDDIVKQYKEENGIKTTQKFVKDEFGYRSTDDLDIKAAFDKKRELTRK